MKKIKAYIIHMLGGATIEEGVDISMASFNLGAWRSFNTTITFLDEVHDKIPEEVYDSLTRKIKDYMKEYEG